MNNNQHPRPAEQPPAADPAAGGLGAAVFDPFLHAASLAGRQPAAPVMAPGWWESVVAPEDPRALELRHIPNLSARDAARVRALFAEVVDAGGRCAGQAWEVLAAWQLGCSAAAAAASEAATILTLREVEAEATAGTLRVPPGFDERAETYVRGLLEDRARGGAG